MEKHEFEHLINQPLHIGGFKLEFTDEERHAMAHPTEIVEQQMVQTDAQLEERKQSLFQRMKKYRLSNEIEKIAYDLDKREADEIGNRNFIQLNRDWFNQLSQRYFGF